MPAPDPTSSALDWQAARRIQGVPTVTVLAGPPGLTARAWRRWAEGRGRPVAHVAAANGTGVAVGWVRETAAADLTAVACDWLAGATGEPPAVTAGRVRRMTLYDLDQAWRGLPADTTAPAAVAARAVLTRAVTGRPIDAAEVVADVAPAVGVPAHANTIRAFCDLLPEARWPALLITRPADGPPAPNGLAAAVRTLEGVAAAVPRLPVAVAATEAEFDALTVGPHAGRAAALAREGHVPVRGVSEPEFRARLAATGVPAPPASTVRRLTADGLSEEAAAAYVEAAAAVRTVDADADDAPARSAAERFLFEQLDAIPATAGLFRLNRPLDFDHGRRAAEADLLAAELRLVVEVDGRYYHLTPERYRADRRKDWLYQRHGYLVLRFLAEDVVEDLEAIVATVAEAVAFRRTVFPA